MEASEAIAGRVVRADYREGHTGVILDQGDPRSWADTIRFPGREPTPAEVQAHLADLAARGIKFPGRHTPVLWCFGVYRETTENLHLVTYATEIKGSWYGVPIPEWLRAFDCRAEDSESVPKAPWGASLWSDERAQVDLGLRGEGYAHAVTPLSCSGAADNRTGSALELAALISAALEGASKVRESYVAAKRKRAKPGEGGGVAYLPVAICLANYGWSVIADERAGIAYRLSGHPHTRSKKTREYGDQ